MLATEITVLICSAFVIYITGGLAAKNLLNLRGSYFAAAAFVGVIWSVISLIIRAVT